MGPHIISNRPPGSGMRSRQSRSDSANHFLGAITVLSGLIESQAPHQLKVPSGNDMVIAQGHQSQVFVILIRSIVRDECGGILQVQVFPCPLGIVRKHKKVRLCHRPGYSFCSSIVVCQRTPSMNLTSGWIGHIVFSPHVHADRLCTTIRSAIASLAGSVMVFTTNSERMMDSISLKYFSLCQ